MFRHADQLIPDGTLVSTAPAAPPPHPKSNVVFVEHSYVDYGVLKDEDLDMIEAAMEMPKSGSEKEELARESIRVMTERYGPVKGCGPNNSTFQNKLMHVLEHGGLDSCIKWLPHGRAFQVQDAEKFTKEVLPVFFKQTKYESFVRQLNIWGFKRITCGPDKGAYYSELFLRGMPRLASRMRRQKVKGTGFKRRPNPFFEPDFLKMVAMPSSRSNGATALSEGEVALLPIAHAKVVNRRSTGDESPEKNTTAEDLLEEEKSEIVGVVAKPLSQKGIAKVKKCRVSHSLKTEAIELKNESSLPLVKETRDFKIDQGICNVLSMGSYRQELKANFSGGGLVHNTVQQPKKATCLFELKTSSTNLDMQFIEPPGEISTMQDDEMSLLGNLHFSSPSPFANLFEGGETFD